MPIEDIRVGITIAAPGADSNDYVLLDTTTGLPGMAVSMGIDRAVVAWNNTQAATLKVKQLRPGTTATFDTVFSASITANGGLTAGPYDFEVVGMGDFQIVVTNGGSAQANWPPSLVLVRGQKASGV